MDDFIDLDLKKDLVKKQACFSKFTSEEIEELAGLFKGQHVALGETIVKEGDPVDSVYLIISGTADVRTSSVKDKEIVTKSVATMGPGDAIGLNDTGFYSLTGLRTATVVSLTDMILIKLSVAEFHGFSLIHSHVNDVMRTYSLKLLGSS